MGGLGIVRITLELHHEYCSRMAARRRLVRYLQLQYPLSLSEFAQPPTNNSCQGMLVWHIDKAVLATFSSMVLICWRSAGSKAISGLAQSHGGPFHRRKSGRAAAASVTDDLRRPGRRLAGGICGHHRRVPRRGIRSDLVRNRRRSRLIGRRKFPAGCVGALKR